MFFSAPKNLENVLLHVPTNVYQLCDFQKEFTLEDQISGLTLIGEEVIRLYPNVHIYLTINPDVSGYVYASLDISDEHLLLDPTIETVVDTIKPIVESILFYKAS